jgi:hypothetical protein
MFIRDAREWVQATPRSTGKDDTLHAFSDLERRNCLGWGINARESLLRWLLSRATISRSLAARLFGSWVFESLGIY